MANQPLQYRLISLFFVFKVSIMCTRRIFKMKNSCAALQHCNNPADLQSGIMTTSKLPTHFLINILPEVIKPLITIN